MKMTNWRASITEILLISKWIEEDTDVQGIGYGGEDQQQAKCSRLERSKGR
jgi:hypothetical protein